MNDYQNPHDEQQAQAGDEQQTKRAEADRPFGEQQWQVLIGLRVTTDPGNSSSLERGLHFGFTATADVMVDTQHGPRPDKSNEAVSFALWVDRNKDFLVGLWREAHAQQENLRRLTEGRIPGMRMPELLGPDGSPLQ